jgi:fructosamine-3-kinase
LGRQPASRAGSHGRDPRARTHLLGCHPIRRGNAATLATGEPVIFDPAVYYGDRETDIALTELFGGFGPAFCRAYHAVYPLPPGHVSRRDIYNLYHVLNHLNLFGGGYLEQAQAMMASILRRAG